MSEEGPITGLPGEKERANEKGAETGKSRHGAEESARLSEQFSSSTGPSSSRAHVATSTLPCETVEYEVSKVCAVSLQTARFPEEWTVTVYDTDEQQRVRRAQTAYLYKQRQTTTGAQLTGQNGVGKSYNLLRWVMEERGK
jgi:DNA replication protein DnaC